MTPIKISIIVFSALVLISFILNFFYESYFFKYYQTFFCYIAQLFMYIGSVILIVAASCNLSNKAFRNGLILLYFADIFSLASIFIFAFWPFQKRSYGYFNWAALISFALITTLIILVHTYLVKNPPPEDINILPNEAPLEPINQ